MHFIFFGFTSLPFDFFLRMDDPVLACNLQLLN